MFVSVASSGTGNRVMTSNYELVNQVKDLIDNVTPTDVMQLVPASGTTPTSYNILYNTQSRIDTGRSWGLWAKSWSDTTLTLENSNVIPINLKTYAALGSCTAAGMPATACPRLLGELGPGQTLAFRAQFLVGEKWRVGPYVNITRPSS